ncbi:hypothetical protein DMB81_009745 [Pectobacterium aquaticum]|nr:hypothetical protein DMB81_009745 [Pectobacterium aquaticum]
MLIITLAGTDGAGKSTQAQLIKDWLKKRGFEVLVVDKWSILDSSQHPECRFINSNLDELRHCISEMKNQSRTLFLFWSIFQSMENIRFNASDKTVFILDGYWIKHAASEIIYGNSEDWVLSITSEFPESDIVLYFDIPVSETVHRKDEFTPYECGRNIDFTKQDFVSHQNTLKKLMDTWCEKFKWTVIDAGLDKNKVFDCIIEHIKKVLP